MSVRHVQSGLTYSFYYSFFTDAGARTSVASPLVDFYNPQKNKVVSQAALTITDVVGKYQYDFFASPGLTIGNYFSIGVGLSAGNTIFSEVNTFEVIDYISQPAWIGLEELRQYMSKEDDDRSDDNNLKTALATAIELCEGHTRRHYGIYSYHETIEVKDTDRIKLKKFPIDSIVGITATTSITPRDTHNLVTESVSGALVSFYYRLDSENGIIYLTDSAGFDYPYDSVLLSIDYQAGFATVPEPVRTAVLKIAAALFNMICTEGLSYVKIGSMSFATERKIFEGPVGDMLAPFINNAQV